MIRIAREWCCDLCGVTAVVTSRHPWPARNAHHTPAPDHPPEGWWAGHGLYGSHLCSACRESEPVREYHRAYQDWGERRRLHVAPIEAERDEWSVHFRAALDAAGPAPECPWTPEARAKREAARPEPGEFDAWLRTQPAGEIVIPERFVVVEAPDPEAP